MKRILLTGITGFTGGALARLALAEGIEVKGLVRPGPSQTALASGLPEAELLPIDTGLHSLRARLADWQPDAVIHLAAAYLPEGDAGHAQQMLAANLTLPVDLLEALAERAPCVFIAAGTQWQHAAGGPGYAPNGFYAATKQAAEDMLRHYADHRGFRAMVLNLADCYGPDDPRKRLIGHLINAQHSQTTLEMSPGDQELDPLHVTDAAAGFLEAARRVSGAPHKPMQNWALRGNRVVTVRDLVAIIEELGGRPVPARFGALPYRPGTVMKLWRQELLPGWSPRTSLEQGLGELIAAKRQEPLPWSA